MRYDDHAKLLLRLLLGILVLFHGEAKVVNGIAGIVGRVQEIGLPGAFAYLVYVGEVLAPLFLLAGYWTRIAAFLIAGNMVVAVLIRHTGQLFMRTGPGGYGLELQAFYLFTAVAIMLFGAGRYSFGGTNQKWN